VTIRKTKKNFLQFLSPQGTHGPQVNIRCSKACLQQHCFTEIVVLLSDEGCTFLPVIFVFKYAVILLLHRHLLLSVSLDGFPVMEFVRTWWMNGALLSVLLLIISNPLLFTVIPIIT